MAVYHVVTLVADLNTLPCINTQGYQTSDAFTTEVANHFSPFLALATHKKGGIPRHTGQEYPLQKKHKKAATHGFLVRGCFLCSNVQFAMAVPVMRLLPSHAFASA
jgi:hypothetical protein